MRTITISAITLHYATQTLTYSTHNPADGDTVTIDGIVYRFKDTLAQNYDVKRDNTTPATSFGNLIKAINASGVNGTDYQLTEDVVHPTVSASGSTTLVVTARRAGTDGNSIAVATSVSGISWPASTLASGTNAVDITAAFSDTTFSAIPNQRITIVQQPSDNPTFSRAIQMTDEACFVKRNGVNSAAVVIASIAKLGVAAEPELSWAPYISASPDSTSCGHTGGASASFSVTATSELTAIYRWQESSDGVSWTDLSSSGIYSGATGATLTITPTTTAQNGYYYRCVVKNDVGSTATSAAQLTVT